MGGKPPRMEGIAGKGWPGAGFSVGFAWRGGTRASLKPLLSHCSCKRRTRASDEDVAQIGPKRIRKAAKREILLCDFEGCGKIFSNRQYLNHHKKYQHVHQKTFTCSEPSCGKSFNFKKHLKEHEKLHSDKRDYICEFCARSFRTSSNLIIHRRIHTGEKPLQCEVCGFTCRQKASLNWHMRKHGATAAYRFSCELCGKRFEKRDNVAAHKSKSHPPPRPPPPPRGGGGGGRWRASGSGMREHPQAEGWRRLVRRSHPPWAESSAMDKGDAGSTRSREGAVLPNAIPGFSAKP
uniref:Zinc finger protein 692 n=1 Tax=Amazona collaria TaxID=241587 RepID=A0A8B9FT26_9PSIT